MTITPPTALHIVPPPSDIKLSPANSSAASHPPPLTPNSANPSLQAVPEDNTYPTPDQSVKSPTTTETFPAQSTMAGADDSGPRHPRLDSPHDHIAVDDGGVSNGGRLGLKCAPPEILPPSPPLTVAEPRDVREEKTNTLAQPEDVAQAPMHEQDITNWRASVNDRAEEEDEDVGTPMSGEYDPYDLGYSTSAVASPVTPVDRRGRAEGVRVSADGPSKHFAVNDPLRLNLHAPSPPLWERYGPPESSENAGTRRTDRTLTENGYPKPLTSRPLIPHSAYYMGPPPIDAAFGTDPVGQLGLHHPREIVRVERDYTGGELIQFASTYPLELEGRVTPTQFLETINTINERLISAHSLRHSFFDNALSFFTLQLSRLVLTTHYDKEMRRLQEEIDEINTKVYNPVGLHILWPRNVAFMFLEIEYY